LGTRARALLISAGVLLSVLAVWSLVGNQALFAGQEALARKDWLDARKHGRRAHALLFWSSEPELVLGDAAAGLGDREGALDEYRDAVATDPESWVAWLRVAQVARGAERADAYRRVRELNPREEGLPGT
jgi:tetratricopeptide (TPR) repeat protein